MGTGALRLCFLTREYALYPPIGGVATYVREAAQWLASQGHDIQVVCVSRQHAPHVTQDGAVTVRFVGARRIRPRRLVRLVSRLPGLDYLHEAFSGWDLLENSLGGWCTIRSLSRAAPFDVIECDDYEGLAFWGLWPAHRYRIVLRGHGIIHLDLPFARYSGARFHHLLERVCASRADFILTASQYLADCYRTELKLVHDRLASLACPLDVRGVSQRHAIRKGWDGVPTLLYVGRLERRKGTDLLFAALERAHRRCGAIRCVLVGSPADEFAQELQAFVQTHGDWVVYAGALSQEEVFRHMAHADMLVLPSRTDTLPRVLIEAQALALPQIGTRVGGIPEIIEHGVTGLLVEGDDVDALADAIVQMCIDEDLRKRMAVASQATALIRYELDAVMTRQLDFYQTIARGTPPGAAAIAEDR